MSAEPTEVLNTVDAALDWLALLRDRPAPKLIVGPRGSGKTVVLRIWKSRLIQSGVPESDILLIDAESPEVTRILSPSAFLDAVSSRLNPERTSYVFIANAIALPNAEATLALLFAQRRYEVIVTSSVKHIVGGMLRKYLSRSAYIAEFIPREKSYPDEVLWATWFSAVSGDVLSSGRQIDLGVMNRIVQYLSDHLGDRLSLRDIASAISVDRMTVSPTTVASYIAVLGDAYILEQVFRVSRSTAKLSKTGSLYLFLRPELRLAKFGPAPENEEARVTKNDAWLKIRQYATRVYVENKDGKDNFVPRK